jgi:hypothetical protein
MRVPLLIAGVLAGSLGASCAPPPPQISAGQLVREVVYNELRNHQSHGNWRYWIESHLHGGSRREDQVETVDGPVTRLVQSGGQPLTPAVELQEQARLNDLLSSPRQQQALRRKFNEDEEQIGRILAMLPQAFLFQYEGDENGCHRLAFRPNPDYPVRSIEARIFHAMSGELQVDERYKRLVRLDGHLDDNVDFGFGLLGRLYKGGWFRLERTQVSATDWKTERMEVHMNGRALLLKSITRETSEVRGGFIPVPPLMSFAQGMLLLDQPAEQDAATTRREIRPLTFAAPGNDLSLTVLKQGSHHEKN